MLLSLLGLRLSAWSFLVGVRVDTTASHADIPRSRVVTLASLDFIMLLLVRALIVALLSLSLFSLSSLSLSVTGACGRTVERACVSVRGTCVGGVSLRCSDYERRVTKAVRKSEGVGWR